MHRWIALLATVLPFAAAAQWTVDGELARSYDDNLSRAQRESDIVRDHALQARGALGRLFVLAQGDLALRVEARAARHDDISGLDHYALGLGAGWRRKLAIGLTAPWIAADAALSREAYEQNLRDGERSSLSATLGKRFDERFEASLGAAYDRRSQRRDLASVPGIPGRPFSLQGRSLFAKASYAFSTRGLAFARIAARSGDVVSSTRRNLQIFRESADIANDPAFGPDFIAYKLTGARTRSGSLGVSWALGRRSALEATLARDLTKARAGLQYDGNLYSFAFVYRD
jgi:hypothetical protein